jgi:hypothetical protein
MGFLAAIKAHKISGVFCEGVLKGVCFCRCLVNSIVERMRALAHKTLGTQISDAECGDLKNRPTHRPLACLLPIDILYVVKYYPYRISIGDVF